MIQVALTFYTNVISGLFLYTKKITLDISAIESERPGCKCVDSFFVDVSPSRLPRRHRLPDAGFIPDVYNLEDVCEIALEIVNIHKTPHVFSLHSGSRA